MALKLNSGTTKQKLQDAFKDKGQERNQDKAGWVNPNGVKQTNTEKKQTSKPATQLPAQLRPVHLMGNPTQSTAQTSSNTKKTKDIGQDRNQDKSGWTNPNGQKTKTASPNSSQSLNNAVNAPKKSNAIGKSVSGSLPKSNKTSGGKPTEKSFTKSKKNVSNKNLKDNNTQKTLKKAFDAVAVMKERRAKAMNGRKAFNAVDAMKERRAKAMANRDPKKNPNNVNLRGIVKTKSKGKKG